MLRTGFLMVLGVAASYSSARAEPFSSAYTSLAPKDCAAPIKGPESSSYMCVGRNGIQVFVGEVDLRYSVSYGRSAEREPAAHQTFAPLQGISETLEWRYDEAPGVRRPIATILRWHLASQEEIPRREILVVTRLPPGPACWVALVDARANRNANDLARKAAEGARSFRCGVDKPLFIGERGTGVTEDIVAAE
jgi:hypothetical protein